MKRMTLLISLLLIITGCDTFHGPFLANSTELVLSVEMERSDGDIIKTKLLPEGKMTLGGHVGGKDPRIKMIRVYDDKGRCVKTIRTGEYSAKYTIIID